MRITTHAAKRFLERVMSKETYNCIDLNFTIKFLEKLLSDVVPAGSATSFEKYKVIYKDGSVITIIPKGEHYIH